MPNSALTSLGNFALDFLLKFWYLYQKTPEDKIWVDGLKCVYSKY